MIYTREQGSIHTLYVSPMIGSLVLRTARVPLGDGLTVCKIENLKIDIVKLFYI